MTRTRATKAGFSAPEVPKLADWCKSQQVAIGDYGSLAKMPWTQLRKFEIFPGCRLDAEVLVLPESWLPPGTSRRPSKRVVKPSKAGVPSDRKLAAARDECVRRALFALWLPRITRRGIRKNGPGSWKKRCSSYLDLAAWQLKNRPSDDGRVFGRLTWDDIVSAFYPAKSATRSMKTGYRAALHTLFDAGNRGVITDFPILRRKSENAARLEPIRKGAAVRKPAERLAIPITEPFSDEFVTDFLDRALWIQRNIADAIVDQLARDKELREGALLDGYAARSEVTRRVRAASILNRDWRNEEGERLVKLPFEIRQSHRDGTEVMSDAWPPPNLKSFGMVVSIIQGCNLGLVAACTGARSSEILAAERVPFARSDDRFHSVTYKLVDEISGRSRDWPLHPTAARAITIQKRLSEVVRPEAGQLWIAMKDWKGTRLTSASAVFDRTVENIGLADRLGSGSAHVHRWRHTVARLVALSIVGAPKVLCDLFGHRDLDMTLHYMLSDPDLAEEARRVAKESTYAMVKEAIVQTVNGEALGAGAASLREHLPRETLDSKGVFDDGSLQETADLLTWKGQYWSQVRRGVICTKGLGQYGPCNRGRGAPDPGACRTTCGHRLELSLTKQQCADTLAALIQERKDALNAGLELVVSNLDGQIISELKRADEVRERVLVEHSDIRSIWEASLR